MALEDLQKQRAQILAEIKRRGGESKAPGFAKRLGEIETQIRTMRGSPQAGGGAETSFDASGYLRLNPDVAREAQRLKASGDPRSEAEIAQAHWNTNGKAEGRQGGGVPQVGDITTTQQGINADAAMADYTANKQTQLNNPNINNPFGSQTVTRDESGNVTVNQTIDPSQQRVVDAGTRLSEKGLNDAFNRMSSGGMGENWNPALGERQNYDAQGTMAGNFDPNLTQRTLQGDLIGDRQRIEDQVFKSLTRNFDRDQKIERDQLEQSLANRGIPIDPTDPQYQRAMQDLGERYDQRKDQAQAQAVVMGGDEYGRSVGVQETMRANDYTQQSGTDAINTQRVRDRFNLGEGVRANQLNEQGTIRTQNFNEIMAGSGIGPGARLPEFQPYTPGQWQVNSPTTVAGTVAGINQGNQQLQNQKRQIDAQIQADAQRARTAAAAVNRMGQTTGGTQTPPPFPTY